MSDSVPSRPHEAPPRANLVTAAHPPFAALAAHEAAGWRWLLYPTFCGAGADGKPTVYIVDLFRLETSLVYRDISAVKRSSFTAPTPEAALGRAAEWLEGKDLDDWARKQSDWRTKDDNQHK